MHEKPTSVNLVHDHHPLDEPRSSSGFFARIFLGVLVVGAIAGTALSYQIAKSSEQENADAGSFFSSVRHFVASTTQDLAGEDDDRINFLFLGIGGAGHDGPELTDTMIFASARPSDQRIGLLSIPRDLTIPIPGYGWRKVNHVNAFAENQKTGSGPEFASRVIGDLLDQDVHYYVKVDFDGFAEVVDALGGVDVYVERAFDDASYPIGDGTVETIHFDAGWQKMDGATALKFVRSRHGTNGEGSDFARSHRQQQILLAVRDKALRASTLLNPAKLNRLLTALRAHIKTNLDAWEIIRLSDLMRGLSSDRMALHVLDTSPDSPLYATTVNGAYVLLPKRDDWKPIQDLADQVFEASPVLTTTAGSVPARPSVTLEIQNGTAVTGLAAQTAQLLESQGFRVLSVSNAPQQTYTKTVIYDRTRGAYPEELERLKQTLQADILLSSEAWLFSNAVTPTELVVLEDESLGATTQADLLIILGAATPPSL